MKTQTKGLVFGAVLAVAGSFALAAAAQTVSYTADSIRSDVEQAVRDGVFTSAELRYAPGQIKLEVVTADGQKVETIFRIESDGALTVLKSESEVADAEDLSRTGIEVRSLSEDFVSDDDSGDDDGLDDGDDSGDDESDDSGDDSGDDDSGDDDGGDDDGGDDSGGDDSGDDDSGDDDSGSDDSGSDDD